MTQDELLRAVYEGVFYGQGPNRENILSLYNEVKYKYNNILDTGAASSNYACNANVYGRRRGRNEKRGKAC